MNAWLEWGIPMATGLQGLGDWLLGPMKFFSFLGTEDFYLLVMPALLWCFDVRLGFRVGLVLLVSASLNTVFKILFHMPRPYWVSDRVRALSSESSFGFPSGHAQNALAVWGRLAAGIGKRWGYVALGLLILAISASRVFLGVHFPLDILGGWLVGGLLLLVALRVEEPLKDRLAAWKPIQTVMFLLSVSLLIILAAWAAASLAPQIPEAWTDTAAQAFPDSGPIHPLDISGVISNAGALFGFAVGGLFLFRSGGFSPTGFWWKRLLRYLVGVLGLVVIYLGLRLLFPPANQVLRYLRYAAVGFWIVYLGPQAFVALRLAEPGSGGGDGSGVD